MFDNSYYVKRTDEDSLSPEETLADSSSVHATVELPISHNVTRIFYFVLAMIGMLFLFQGFRLQIVRGDHFMALADQSRFHQYEVPALRGYIYDRYGKPIVKNVPIFDLVAVQSQLDEKSKAHIPEEILKKNYGSGVFVVRKDISKEDAINMQNAQLPGLYVVSYARRHYEYGSALAHVVGYTSQVTQDELDRDPTLQRNERVGRLGIESTYDSELRGESYQVFLDSEATRTRSPQAGESITTNLDIEAQLKLHDALDQVLRSAGIRRGAAVVQKVSTGEILAMVSMPTFDPNVFENTALPQNVSMLSSIFSDKNKPLFNRVVTGLYAPGSTIKPLYALAGLREHIVDESTMIFSDGALEIQSEVDASAVFTFRDWKVHGWSDIRKAISDSVDVYFYALGGGYGDIRGLGVDLIEKYLRTARVDQLTGVDLPAEVEGFVPSKKWKREEKNDSWYIGDTYNLSIGQGDLLVTPMWLSMYVGALANGGNLMKPQIVHQEPEVLSVLPFDEATKQIVREGMRRTITDGTAQMLKDLPVAVAAKTGTAQISGRGLNSLFIVYGPYENPDISMTILVENIPQSQSLAVQVAKNFLSWYFTR